MMGNKSSCTPQELVSICEGHKGKFSIPSSNSIDQVYDRVFIGGASIAKDKIALSTLGITHVVNCAESNGEMMFHVDTNQAYYQDTNIKYLGLPVSDEPGANIKQYFKKAAKFIDEALKQEDSNVLVHCVAGFSRSATITIAYLMISHGMTAQEATRTVRKNRCIGPNEGFLRQLCQLNTKLHPL